MRAIYKRELKSYFYSMTGYVFIAFVTMFIGDLFYVPTCWADIPTFPTPWERSSLSAHRHSGADHESMSEEHHSRTDQLLLHLPRLPLEVVMGKYLSMVTVFAIPMLAISCPLSSDHQGWRHRLSG